MIRAMYSSASGMRAQQQNIDVIANNLANVNTTGYKRSQVNFQDLLYETVRMPGSETSGQKIPVGIQFGLGTKMVSTSKVFSQGRQIITETPTDITINGEGLFKIDMLDGTFAYTRDGHFHINDIGELATADGKKLDGVSGITANGGPIIVSPDGTVSQSEDGTIQQRGSITVSKFVNNAGLEALGNNLYRETPASGTATDSTPGQDGTGELRQGILETSNVEAVTEMVNLIAAQRAYEINTQAIRASDEMLAALNNLRR